MTQAVIDVNLRVVCADESTAARVAEVMSRLLVGLSAEPATTAGLTVDRYEPHCDHDHDEVQP